MKSKILSCLVFSLLLLSSCKKDIIRGRGAIVTQERSIVGFNRVKIKNSTDVVITQGASFRVIASDYENIINDLETIVSGDELIIGYKNDVWVTRGNSKVTIVMPVLKGVHVQGSGNCTAAGAFTATGTFNAFIQGSGDITLSGLLTDDFNGDISGSGSISVADAKSKTVRVEIDGSGKMKAFGLQCETANVNVSGSGNTELSVSNQLTVRISGSGSVFYTGNPSVNSTISGSGKVIKK